MTVGRLQIKHQEKHICKKLKKKKKNKSHYRLLTVTKGLKLLSFKDLLESHDGLIKIYNILEEDKSYDSMLSRKSRLTSHLT